jgi:hypothetical protein
MLRALSSVSRLRWIVLAGCGIVLIAMAAGASAYPDEVVRKCRGDYKRLCPEHKLNSDELDQCMRSQHRSISTLCINALVDAGLAPSTVRR